MAAGSNLDADERNGAGKDPAADLSEWHALWRGTPRTTPRWLIRTELVIIAVLVLGLAAIIATGYKLNPSYDEATYLLSELRELSRAGERWAEAEGAAEGTITSYEEVLPFIRPADRKLVERGTDPLGASWPEFRVGLGYHPRVAAESWDQLTPIMGEAFWEPYTRGEGPPPELEEVILRPPQHD